MINARIKQIRKDKHMTQEEFAKKLGTSRTNIAKYETGINEPSSAVITLICKEFNVNELWLKTGNGTPYMPMQTNDIIAKAAAMLGQKDPLFESIVDVYSRLTDSDKNIILKFMNDLVTCYKEKHHE